MYFVNDVSLFSSKFIDWQVSTVNTLIGSLTLEHLWWAVIRNSHNTWCKEYNCI